ncbi:MAG TPA: hypothetical protein VJC20_00495 [Candidatus Paceibacterota bacterium]
MNTETKNCQNCKKDFRIEPEDFDFYTEIHVPPPTWCPQCRLIRRFSWQGYRVLYKRKCDFSGEVVVSAHHPNSRHPVYRQDIWWSDKWDPKTYGQEYDFSRPFFEQYINLIAKVPLPSLYTAYSTMVNSDYCNAASGLKDCYLCFRITGGEDSAYLNTIVDARNSLDTSFSNHIELCYGSVRLNQCYQAFFSRNCEGCQNILFSRDLVGCSYCIGCINLRSKQYHIFNKPYSKEEYENFVKTLDLGTPSALAIFQKKVDDFIVMQPRKQFSGRKNTDVSSEYISNSKNVKNSYMLNNGEDLRYCQFLKDGPAAKAYDYSFFGDGAEWIYECCWTGLGANNNKFGSWNYGAHDIEYCFGCHNSGNLFGCVGIRKGEYCILNKQYSKSEYQELLFKIKKHMSDLPYRDPAGHIYRYGEMFPSEISPWAYNDSTAHDFFPLTKEEALAEGFRWRDPDQKEYGPATIEVPDHIKDVIDDILKGILKCGDCGRNYQIISMELEFYRKMNIPIPRQCPLCRDRARIKLLNPIKIYIRTCAKCGKQIETSYAPDRPEIVYCEACYQNEVA